MKKIIEIQNELKVPKGNINKFGNYKYRSAEDILEAAKPILRKHEALLTLTDSIEPIGGKLFLKATAQLTFAEVSVMVTGFAELSEHKGMSAEQCTGTASSYARKYALNGLFLIDETEADADHEAVKEAPKVEKIKPKFTETKFEAAHSKGFTIEKIKETHSVDAATEAAYLLFTKIPKA